MRNSDFEGDIINIATSANNTLEITILAPNVSSSIQNSPGVSPAALLAISLSDEYSSSGYTTSVKLSSSSFDSNTGSTTSSSTSESDSSNKFNSYYIIVIVVPIIAFLGLLLYYKRKTDDKIDLPNEYTPDPNSIQSEYTPNHPMPRLSCRGEKDDYIGEKETDSKLEVTKTD